MHYSEILETRKYGRAAGSRSVRMSIGKFWLHSLLLTLPCYGQPLPCSPASGVDCNPLKPEKKSDLKLFLSGMVFTVGQNQVNGMLELDDHDLCSWPALSAKSGIVYAHLLIACFS